MTTRTCSALTVLLTMTLLWGCGTAEPPWPEDATPDVTMESLPAAPVTPPPSPGAAGSALGNLPLAFEENQGQYAPQALFAARHGTSTFFFTTDSLAAVFTRTVHTSEPALDEQPGDNPDAHDRPDQGEPETTEKFALMIEFLGVSGEVTVEGEGPLQGKVSYFRGNDPQGWVSGAATFERIIYRDLWPGVDLTYSGSAGRLNAEYRLAQAADAALIRLRYQGQDALRLDESGRLVIATPWGDLHEESPRAAQHDRPVEIAYGLDADTGEVWFELENVDPDAPLVINP